MHLRIRPVNGFPVCIAGQPLDLVQYAIAVILFTSSSFYHQIPHRTNSYVLFLTDFNLSLEHSILCCAYHLELTAEESITSRDTCRDKVQVLLVSRLLDFLPHLKQPCDATALHCHSFSELSNVIMKLHR